MAGSNNDKQTGGNTHSTFSGTSAVGAILRLPAVLNKRGISKSTHYVDIQEGLFTQPVVIGLRAVGWPEREVDAINAARIAGKTDDEIRSLVTKLEAARKASA